MSDHGLRSMTIEPTPPPGRVPGLRLAAGQLGYATRDGWRTPLLTVLTALFPLVFLIMLGLASRDAPPDPVTGVEVIQHTAPIASVFAAVMASYVLLAFQISQARERGVLKRLRGTPLPLWAFLAGRFGYAALLAVVGSAVMFAVAVGAFGLEFPAARLPAMMVLFVLGVACFAALGFAAAMVLRGSEAVLTFTMGSFLLVAFASGIFAPGLALPRPLDVASWVLPVRHFATAFGEQFEPTGTGSGLAWEHPVMLAAWLIAGAWLGLRRLSWEPARANAVTEPRFRLRRRARAQDRPPAAGAVTPSRPSLATMVWGQFHQANQQIWRDPGSVFFAVLFPVLFVVVVPYAFGQPVIDGVELARMVVPGMAVFGAAVTAYVNLAETVALARQRGVLKRLRGTPLPAGGYVVGRLSSALYVGLLGVSGVVFAGWVVHGVDVPFRSIPALLVVFAGGIPALAALGLALAALVSDAKSVPAVALGTFLPLGFVSDVIAFGVLPEVLHTIGWLFPFKHLVRAADLALGSGALAWTHLAAVLAWGAAGALVAVLRFRWQPRPG